MVHKRRIFPSIEFGVLGGMCLLDAISTLILIQCGIAYEANCLLRLPLESWGAPGFLAVKAMFSVAPLIGLSRIYNVRREFVLSVMRIAIVLYFVEYVFGVIVVNS